MADYVLNATASMLATNDYDELKTFNPRSKHLAGDSNYYQFGEHLYGNHPDDFDDGSYCPPISTAMIWSAMEHGKLSNGIKMYEKISIFILYKF